MAGIAAAVLLLAAGLSSEEPADPSRTTACDEAEQQFQSLLSGESEPTTDLLDGYCESECLSAAGSTTDEPAAEAGTGRLAAMRRLCLRQDGEYCFPGFTAALQVLADAEEEPLPEDALEEVCTPCALKLYADLLALGPAADRRSSPLELVCARDPSFCATRTRRFLEGLELLDTGCDPVPGSECRSQLLEFAGAVSRQDTCVQVSLQRYCGTRYVESNPEELEAALESLRRTGAELTGRTEPTATELERYQQVVAALQEQLDYAMLLFQPTEMLDMEFSGAEF
ncbi:MAG: hypothetical protein WDA75_06695 [Candidatus Latescibacterota bacterium]|jgi:hypothetical protein